VLGSRDDDGVVPRVADKLLGSKDPSTEATVSILELYNEHARDLLAVDQLKPSMQKPTLQMKTHPTQGVYCDGLIEDHIETSAELRRCVDFACKMRVVGATNMNTQSSRSHAVFIIRVFRTVEDRRTNATLYIVDLAGSERVLKTGASGQRLDEAKSVNKSLSTLAMVIAALGKKSGHIPFRDSKLTHLLQSSLSGNCTTALLATLAPESVHAQESVSTLRFAMQCKLVQTNPIKNEVVTLADKAAQVQSLQDEVAQLKAKLARQEGGTDRPPPPDLRLATLARKDARELALAELGLSSKSLLQSAVDGTSDLSSGAKEPYLVNVADDPLLSGLLVFPLIRGDSTVGRRSDAAICLSGLGIKNFMCRLQVASSRDVWLILEREITSRSDAMAAAQSGNLPIGRGENGMNLNVLSKVLLFKSKLMSALKPARITVNGIRCTASEELYDKDEIVFGRAHRFSLCIPGASNKRRPMPPDSEKLRRMYVGEELARAQLCVGHWRACGVSEDDIQTSIDKWKELVDLAQEANDLLVEMPDLTSARLGVEVMLSPTTPSPHFAITGTPSHDTWSPGQLATWVDTLREAFMDNSWQDKGNNLLDVPLQEGLVSAAPLVGDASRGPLSSGPATNSFWHQHAERDSDFNAALSAKVRSFVSQRIDAAVGLRSARDVRAEYGLDNFRVPPTKVRYGQHASVLSKPTRK
jgi:hypothetical protein